MENARALKKRRCWVCAAGIRSGIRQTSRGFSTRPSFGLAKLIQIVRNTEDEGGAGEERLGSQPAFLSLFLLFFPLLLLAPLVYFFQSPSSGSRSFQKAIV